jgi:hypothetical protein
MTLPRDKYTEYADHPRYGRRPKITGLNPDPLDREVNLHWIALSLEETAARIELLSGHKWEHGDLASYARDMKRIPNTAIPADRTRQTAAVVPVTHYFDVDRMCLDCARRFIFFAEEQRHWYEELGFGLESDCVRCVDCRKRQQGLAQKRQRYEDLFHKPDRTGEESVEMAEYCLLFIESSIFSKRQTQRVRLLLNNVANAPDDTLRVRCAELLARVRTIEAAETGNL